MREIKFRAWDKKNKIMLFSGGWTLIELTANYAEWQGLDLEWLQYTSLHDIHGAEIYEGDVVERVVEFSVAVGELLDLKHTKEVGVIKWDFNRWVVKDWGFVPGHWEVIGNIYENPELLGTN